MMANSLAKDEGTQVRAALTRLAQAVIRIRLLIPEAGWTAVLSTGCVQGMLWRPWMLFCWGRSFVALQDSVHNGFIIGKIHVVPVGFLPVVVSLWLLSCKTGWLLHGSGQWIRIPGRGKAR